MQALLLAAGQSKRMKPVVDKNFLSFLGKPLIRHQIEMLMDSGFRDIIVVGGAHNLERLSEMVEEVSTDIMVVEQENLELGMAGAVISAEKHLKGQELLIFSSNDVVEKSAFELIQKEAAAHEAESFILGKKVTRYFPGGYLEVDAQGFIMNIVEKPEPGSEPSDLVNLVVHLHRRSGELIRRLKETVSEKDDLYERAIRTMIREGARVKAVSYQGFWQPIKFPWHIQPVFEHLMAQAEAVSAPSAEIAESAVIRGKVIIGEGVKIFDHAVISGPAYIGAHSVVATGALVRNSHIGARSVVGFGSEVARSFLGERVWTHSNYIGDSVIGDNVSFGAGTVTGNLRLDEGTIKDSGQSKLGLVTGDHVRVGVNVSTMPGVRIGSNCVVGPGITVHEDIEDNNFVRGDFQLKISENTLDISRINRDDLK